MQFSVHGLRRRFQDYDKITQRLQQDYLKISRITARLQDFRKIIGITYIDRGLWDYSKDYSATEDSTVRDCKVVCPTPRKWPRAPTLQRPPQALQVRDNKPRTYNSSIFRLPVHIDNITPAPLRVREL